MAYVDIFNGDADGICALIQLRRAQPRDSRLVTGVKRDIALVDRAGLEGGDQATILDISMEKNVSALRAALDGGASCFYVDHHFAGDIPDHDGLTALIDPAPDVCTSLLVDRHLGGEHIEWALVGAFGDNLHARALRRAKPLSLTEAQLGQLAKLGLYVNYNAYGAKVEDLHFAPDQLFRLLCDHSSPFQFLANDTASYTRLEEGYRQDMARAAAVSPETANDRIAVFILPDADWARRVSGVYSNDLANAYPDRAHAVLTRKTSGNFLISIRAPLNNKLGADEVCRQFPTGGGRKAAAGINDLPSDQLTHFIDIFSARYV